MKEFIKFIEIVGYIFFTIICSTLLGAYVLVKSGQIGFNGGSAFLFGLYLVFSFVGFIFLCYRIYKFFKEKI